MEKSQNLAASGEACIDFLEYLFPRLFPNCTGLEKTTTSGMRQGGRGSYPNIKSALDQLKRQTSPLVCQTHPHLGVHEQPMVQIDNSLLNATRSAIDLLSLLPSAPLQSVDAQQVPIFRLHYMLLGLVSPDPAELDEIGRISNGGGYCCRGLACDVGQSIV